jgi:hypothetical protein
MLSTVKCIIDVPKRARGNENPKVGRKFGDLGKTFVLEFTGKYAEKVTSCLPSATLIQCFDHD